ncbi:MAG: extracellular solute-binding protein [Spirochaetia bacterium]|nr:extracellular solute-binding protein [Spirochaetia bacterium]MDD7269253.1 extracellular solute-binding protein [Treponema sp.]MDY4985784.1 extracellular solute-binding protein [Treponema sp.]
MVGFKISKKLRITAIVIVAIVLVFVINGLIPEKNFSKKYEGVDLSTSIGTSSAIKTYAEYLNEHKNAKNASKSVSVDIFNFDKSSTGTRVEKAYHGKDVVLTEDRSSVTWYVDVPEAGFYNISMEYIAVPSRNVTMERILYINDEMPFNGADILSFYRLWKDGGPVKYDNQGNSIRPSQVEFYDYQTVRFKSDLGYEVDPYKFYFKKGVNSIKLVSTNEPIAISKLSLETVYVDTSYEQYVAKQPVSPDKNKAKDVYVKVQGEDSIARSDPSLFARYDRSSAITEPYSVKNTILNYTGGDSWKASGQWIEWEADIPEDGWYTISFQARQLYARGAVSCRSLYIDGVIPMKEVKAIEFDYSSDWKYVTLGAKNDPYKFYLTKGKHNIRLEATLGELGRVISGLQDSIYRMNIIYRTILVLTGVYPDQFRDYEIDKVYPEQVEAMNIESKRLYKLIDDYIEITGGKSENIAMAEKIAVQLEQFYARPEKITKTFSNFKDNVTSLGSSLLSMTECKLDVDYLVIQGADDKIKPKKSNFFKNAKHEIVSFFTSFFVDSTNLGNVYAKDAEHVIQVWIVTGRDQSQILKNMIDDSFTVNTGINVNVKLIDITSLLNAVVAGNGPDVVVSTDASKPVNYALRGADVNLMRFDDCEEVLKQFYPSAYEAYKYDGGVYALPETQTFNLLFYRKDILEQLGLEVPQTWDELIEMLPTLQGNNLNVGVPYPTLQAPDMTTFYSMVFQNGGDIYNATGTKSALDSEASIAAFKTYTSLYNSYGLPSTFDFVSRFRSAEMPIGIANYTTYNTLTVSAPEIRGLWDFTYLPGTEKVDENGNTYIDRRTTSGGVGCMMIKKGLDLSDLTYSDSSNISYDSIFAGKLPEGSLPNVDEKTLAEIMKNETRMHDSWEFMKWWVSAETQLRFGREQEALLGSSARYATANVEALKQLSWSSAQIEVLSNSLEETYGIPEVPGSYYTPRHIVNAARMVVNRQDDPRETLIDYTRDINEELTRKRQEFNLPVDEE